MNEILQVQNVIKYYGTGCVVTKALNDISFEVEQGEFTAIMGASGSGKSTLLKTLYFDQAATSGAAYLSLYEEGKTNFLQVSSQQKRYLRNHLMGMVYQNPMLGLRMKLSSGANVAEKLTAGDTFYLCDNDNRFVVTKE